MPRSDSEDNKRNSKDKKSVSFIRHYNGYTGGHQKVRDYKRHFIDLHWQTNLFLDGQSATMPDLFANIPKVNYQPTYDPTNADIVFLAGMDWATFLPLGIKNKTVVNLIQHVRHADSKQPLFPFLAQPAVRICVSESVKQAILPHANGPVYTVPMGHKIEMSASKKTNDIYILANKQPELGRRLASYFKEQQFSVICHDQYIEKHAVLTAMASSSISVTLPHPTEGFYLPGIEAMALSDIAVVPDCVASVEYTGRFNNALRCELDYEDVINAVKKATKLIRSPLQLEILKYFGYRRVNRYSLEREKIGLSKLLKQNACRGFYVK
jgi:hypothetical protein